MPQSGNEAPKNELPQNEKEVPNHFTQQRLESLLPFDVFAPPITTNARIWSAYQHQSDSSCEYESKHWIICRELHSKEPLRNYQSDSEIELNGTYVFDTEASGPWAETPPWRLLATIIDRTDTSSTVRFAFEGLFEAIPGIHLANDNKRRPWRMPYHGSPGASLVFTFDSVIPVDFTRLSWSGSGTLESKANPPRDVKLWHEANSNYWDVHVQGRPPVPPVEEAEDSSESAHYIMRLALVNLTKQSVILDEVNRLSGRQPQFPPEWGGTPEAHFAVDPGDNVRLAFQFHVYGDICWLKGFTASMETELTVQLGEAF